MSESKFGEIIAEIKTDIKYIVKAIDELREQSKFNTETHSDLYNKIEYNYKYETDKFATKDQVGECWGAIKSGILLAIGQLFAVIYLLIEQIWK